MIRVTFVSKIMTIPGGGSKDIALLFQYLDRKHFDPRILAGADISQFTEAYGIPRDRWTWCNFDDPGELARNLAWSDVVIMLVGTGDHRTEFQDVFWVARKVGAKACIERIVFGLGCPKPEDADAFLTSSMDSYLVGSAIPNCFVLYPPLPKHPHDQGRLEFRKKYGIPESHFVIGYACADQRSAFYDVASLLKHRTDFTFLSALSPLNGYESVENVKHCNFLHQNEMAHLYNACDMILHARTESFGYSVYQALAARKPALCLWTDSRNAFAEAMTPNGGYLARDVGGLAMAVEHIHGNPVEARGRSEIAFGRLAQLSPESAARRLGSIILNVLAYKGLRYEIPDYPISNYPGPQDIAAWHIRRKKITEDLRVHPFI